MELLSGSEDAPGSADNPPSVVPRALKHLESGNCSCVCGRRRGGLTCVDDVKADDADSGLFVQVLQLALPAAAQRAVHLPEDRGGRQRAQGSP